jgi:hypothetical protein
LEKYLRRRRAKFSEGDAHRSSGELRLDEGARDVNLHMLRRLLAEGGLQLRREEVGNGLERNGDAILGWRRGVRGLR